MLVASIGSLNRTCSTTLVPTPVAPEGRLIERTVGATRSAPGAVVNVTAAAAIAFPLVSKMPASDSV